MANYYGTARSNYVRFDPYKLEALAKLFPIEAVPKLTTYKDGMRHAIFSKDEGGTPSEVSIDPTDEDHIDALIALGFVTSRDQLKIDELLGRPVEIPDTLDFIDTVHMAFAEDPGDPFIWIWSGQEGLRYVDGGAIALGPDGEVIHQVSLSDIYDMNKIGPLTSLAEY